MLTRIFVLLAVAICLSGIAIAPDLLLQIVFRGGFIVGGIAITLALRPADDDGSPALPVARVA